MRVKPAFWAFLAKKGPFRPFSASRRRGFTSTPPRPSPGGGGAPPGLREPGDRGPRGPGRSGDLRGPGIPGQGPGSPSRPGGEAPGGPGTGSGRPRVRGFTSTPRAGPPRFPGGVPGSPVSRRGPAGLRRPPGRSWDRPLPGEGPPGYRGAPAGVGAPEGGSEGSPLLLPEEGSSVPGRCLWASPTPVF